MKKSLVALAALAATASFAQSTVTISGIVDANYATVNAYGQKINQVQQNGARTSTFKFNGVEDLGGGAQAVFQFEVNPSYIASNTNTSGLAGNTLAAQADGTSSTTSKGASPSGLVGAGQSYLGYNNSQFGNVKLGTINTQLFGTIAAVSQLGTGIGSGYNTGIIPNVTRLESSASYETPVYNGFSAAMTKGFGTDAAYGSTTTIVPARATVVDYGLTYANGPLTVKYASYASTSTPATGVTTTTKLLGAVYDAGVAKLSIGSGSQKSNEAAPTTDTGISVYAITVPFMGTYRAIAQQTQLKYKIAGTNFAANEANKITGFSVEKDLSKRTFVYLRNERATLAATNYATLWVNGAVGTATTDKNRTITAVGISHQF